MNIMILNHYAGSDKMGMEFRPLYIGRELVKQGHNVTVIAADYSHLRVQNPVVQKSFDEEDIDGVRYVYIKTTKYNGNGVKRFINMMQYTYKLKSHAKQVYEKYKPDVVVASSTYPYDMRAAQAIASFNPDVRICFEIHDIWPLSLIELHGLKRSNPYIQSLQKAEINAYENADCIVSVLPRVDLHMKDLGFESTNYHYVPNGVIVDESKYLPANPVIAEEINKLKKDGKFVVMYLGGFAEANALEDLIDSAKSMPSEVEIVLIGDGIKKQDYLDRIEKYNLKNIKILGRVDKLEVNNTLKLADVLYIGARRSNLYKYGVGMNKLFEYMLSSRPIIYGIDAANDPVSEAHCGESIEPENPMSIVFAVKKLLKLPKEDLDKMGKNAYEYVITNHNYEKLAKKFANSISPFKNPIKKSQIL